MRIIRVHTSKALYHIPRDIFTHYFTCKNITICKNASRTYMKFNEQELKEQSKENKCKNKQINSNTQRKKLK